MTPEYPPFRVDPGEHDPAVEQLVIAGTEDVAGPAVAPRRWGFGRVLAVVLGCLVLLAGLGAVAAGVVGLVVDHTQRDSAGYLMSNTRTYATTTHAITSDSFRVYGTGPVRDVVGTVRVRVQSSSPVFIGIGPTADVDRYLAGTGHAVARQFDAGSGDFRTYSGGPPATRPAQQTFWAAATTGTGTRTITWRPSSGHWRLVAMNSDGSSGVRVQLAAGASVPHLGAFAAVAFGAAVLFLVIGGLILFAALRRPQARAPGP
jgi:hypothetical protein